MNEHEPFLQAICADSESDGPRLVFADWLDEQGDADFAEFIRVQVRIARTTLGEWDRYCELSGRQSLLWERLAPAWRAAVGDWLTLNHYRRGFLAERRTMTCRGFLYRCRGWWPAVPVMRLGLFE